MLFRETATVYCENHIKLTNTLCGRNTVRVPLRSPAVAEPSSRSRLRRIFVQLSLGFEPKFLRLGPP
jgi:hypothetical protein